MRYVIGRCGIGAVMLVLCLVGGGTAWVPSVLADEPTVDANSPDAVRQVMIELGIVAIERRAIFADDLVVVAHVAEDVRMVEGRLRPDAHEFTGPDLDHRDAGVVVEMRYGVVGHRSLAKPRICREQPLYRAAP